MGKDTVRSVERALRILQAFSATRAQYTLTELGQEVGLSLSTLHRLLGTLHAHGFVEQDENTGKYALGLTLFELGALVQQRMDIRRQSQIPLRHLAHRTQETAYLCILDKAEALCLDRVEGQHQVRVLALDVGGRLPLNCGAAPRALLASLPDDKISMLIEMGDMKKLAAGSLVSPNDLWNDVLRTREQGYTHSVDDVTEGVAAIGAPVKDYSNQVVGAISIAGLLPHFGEERLPELIKIVCQEAREISSNLGWVKPDTRT
jgi:IclR family KDG regulon transcriptional repressor